MSLTTNIFGQTGTGQPPAAAPALADEIIASLQELYRELDTRPDLRPGPVVDDLFGRLVRLVLTAPAPAVPAVLDDLGIRDLAPRLRALCARGEGEMELSWADRIHAAGNPRQELTRFRYFDNYRQLSRLELGVLAAAIDRPVRSLAFIGSGPLPLSSLFLAGDLDLAVDNFDRDAVALEAGARVAAAVGYPDFRFHQVDAADAELSGYDVVVLAALVGDTAEAKRHLLGRLAASMRPGAILLARSARGLRTLLYPPVDASALGGFELLTEVHPVNDVINSAIVARALGR